MIIGKLKNLYKSTVKEKKQSSIFDPSDPFYSVNSRFITACWSAYDNKSEDLNLFKSLLAEGADINVKKDRGLTCVLNYEIEPDNVQTALFGACVNQNAKLVKLLLDNGADVHTKSLYGRTAALQAAATGNIEILKLLSNFAGKTYLKDTDSEGRTCLIFAVMSQNSETVKFLLEQDNSHIDDQDSNGNTALIIASCKGYTEIVKLLLERKAKVRAKNDQLNNSLIMSSINGHTEIVKLLLEEGACMYHENIYGATASEVACRNKHIEIAKLLLDYSIDINLKNKKSINPLEKIIIRDRGIIIEFLEEYDQKNSD